MAKINKDIPTVDIIEAMFPRPLGADDKWAYRHGVYKEVRKHQRRGKEFTVAWSNDIWTMLILGDEGWYMVPTEAIV
jgi:hypothetical protein